MTDSQKLDCILTKVNKLDGIEKEIVTLKGELDEVRSSLKGELDEVRSSLKGELDEVRSSLKDELEEIRDDVNGIKIIIENEIRPNIQRIAEGHLDLSRNLHDVIKYKDEIEMLSIRSRMLESEVRELKKTS